MSAAPTDGDFKPQEKAPPPEFQEWGATTTIGMLAGMVYGGLREGSASSPAANHDAVLPPKPTAGASPGPPTGRTTYAARRVMMEQRLVRISKGTVRGGVQLGALTGLFSGVQLSLAAHRGQRDTWNTVAAGAVSAGVLGLAMPGSVKGRLQSAAAGTVIGSLLALPLGLLQTTLQTLVPPPPVTPPPTQASTGDGVGPAIERMQRRFGSRLEDSAAKGGEAVEAGASGRP